MAANPAAIKAALAGQSGTLSTAFFGPTGTAAPTSTASTLNAAFKDAGLVLQSGMTESDALSTTDVTAFGSLQPVRRLITAEAFTIKLTFLETNAISTAVYYRQALGSITPGTGTGIFSITEGLTVRQQYSAVFDITDGLDAKRVYCPIVEVTDKDDIVNTPTGVIQYGVTLTCYPNSSGTSRQTFFTVAALG